MSGEAEGENRQLSLPAQDKSLPAQDRPRTERSVASCPVPEAKASGDRREKIPSMLRRCNGWDYKQPAIYQITLTLEERRGDKLGRIEVRGPFGEWVPLYEADEAAQKPDDVEARVVLSPLGEEILALWKRFGEFTPEIKPLYCEIMPDHIHGILQVTSQMKRPLGNAIGGFKTGCGKVYQKLSLLAQNKAQDKAQEKLFSEGFQDTILFHRGQLDNMFNYLRDNARRRAIKALFPDLFKVVREQKVVLRIEPSKGTKGLSPLAQDRLQAERSVASGSVPEAKASGYFSAIGNRFLLDRPLVQAQVSRSFLGYRRDERRKIVRNSDGSPVIDFSTAEFCAHRDALFAAAKHGAVIISPCVSDGERQIAREALEAGIPLVTLQNKGFSPMQKPPGRYFDACADGRLLMLAPAAWPYQPGEKPMTRFDATALNRLAQWLAGEGAAEINYHGMQPENIDEPALAAVKASEGTNGLSPLAQDRPRTERSVVSCSVPEAKASGLTKEPSEGTKGLSPLAQDRPRTERSVVSCSVPEAKAF